jgi:hypothetical protein
MKLAKREPLFSKQQRKDHPMMRAFLPPQREHPRRDHTGHLIETEAADESS